MVFYLKFFIVLLIGMITNGMLSSVIASADGRGGGSSVKTYRRVCFFANWAPYRGVNPNLLPDKIDPFLCTHIHYAFAKIDPTSLKLEPTEEHDNNWTERSNIPLYIRLFGLKRKNPSLKIILAVGGWSAKSRGFNRATQKRNYRQQFIEQSINFLREWNFDGIDIGM
jgi:chitinase